MMKKAGRWVLFEDDDQANGRTNKDRAKKRKVPYLRRGEKIEAYREVDCCSDDVCTILDSGEETYLQVRN